MFDTQLPEIKTINIMGVTVTPLTIDQLNKIIETYLINYRGKCIIAGHNLHSIYLTHSNVVMQSFYNTTDYVRIDSMPLILIGKLLGYSLKREQRVTYMDWIMPLMKIVSENKWRIYYLGAGPGVAEKGVSILQRQYSALQIATNHGFFNPSPGSKENNEIIEAINIFKPNILMVGMGMPRQELWVLDNLEKLDVKIILTCGACMDYIAGVIPTPPRWMGRLGLEWLFRLCSEPRRLWKRYLVEPWFLLGLLIKDIWHIRIKNQAM